MILAIPRLGNAMRYRAVVRVTVPLLLSSLFTVAGIAHASCIGDCNDNGSVTVDELMLGVNQVLGVLPVAACTNFDANGDTAVDVAEVTEAVGNALQRCPTEAEVAQSEVARQTSPTLPPDALAELVAGNSQFAFDLYHSLSSQPGNLFFSPHSISMALAMLYGGTASETERQTAQVLHFTLPQSALHPALNALDLELAKRGKGRQGADGKGFRLNVTNALWGARGYRFLPSYLDLLAANYGSGLRLLDFGFDPEGSRELINAWVSERTEGRIRDLIADGQITPLTRLVLTNAIYFNAAWAEPFPSERSGEELFHLDGDQSAAVTMMHETTSLPYAVGNGYQALDLPYDGMQLAMLIVLPDAGRFAEVEARTKPRLLGDIVHSLSSREVDLAMPQFTYSTRYELADTLIDLGMRDAFMPGIADLSGIDGTRDLSVDFVIHKAFVKVNEAGTEAAAATAIGVGITSVPPPPIPVRIDRPFIFVVRDRPTGALLFVGRVNDPRG